jgi:hypothetical protein
MVEDKLLEVLYRELLIRIVQKLLLKKKKKEYSKLIIEN